MSIGEGIVLAVVVLVAVPLSVLLGGLVLAKLGVGPWRYGAPDRAEIERAAAEDVAAVRESDHYARPDTPERRWDRF